MKDIKDFENRIICGDCLEIMGDLPDNSIDLVLTDPPYGIDSERIGQSIFGDEDLSYYYRMLSIANRVLKPDAWLITFSSIRKMPDMFLNNPFKFEWLVYVYYSNMQRIRHIPIGRSKCDAVLIFKKGNPKRHYAIWDINEIAYDNHTDAEMKDRLHPTAKIIDSLFNLIKFGSNKNDIVIDPFSGSGTTALACKKLNRRYIGIEINPDYCKIAEKRLANIPNRLDSYESDYSQSYKD